EDNLASMTELAHANGIQVVLSSVMPINNYTKNKNGQVIFQSSHRPPEKILALNKWIKKFAAEHNCVYLDYFSAMVDDKGFLKQELSHDGLHPNTEGYKVMAPLAEKAIAEALKKKTNSIYLHNAF
ncbi:MAG: GDSL-type esterase/lipase family protein, partial [Thermoguttaceae bacterium]